MDALLRCLLQQMRRFVGEAVHRRRGLGRQQQVGGRLHGGIPPGWTGLGPVPRREALRGERTAAVASRFIPAVYTVVIVVIPSVAVTRAGSGVPPLPAGPALGGIRGPSRRSVSAPSAPVTLRKLSGCAGFAAGIPRPINGCGPAIRQLHPQRHARRKQNAVQQYFSRRFGHDLPVLPNPVYDFLLVCAASPVSCFPPPFVKDPAFSASWLSQYKSARMPASTLAVRSSSS